MLETGNHFLSLIMVHLSQTELILPVPVFILEDDAIMQQRLKRILLEIGYAEDALIFAQTLSNRVRWVTVVRRKVRNVLQILSRQVTRDRI